MCYVVLLDSKNVCFFIFISTFDDEPNATNYFSLVLVMKLCFRKTKYCISTLKQVYFRNSGGRVKEIT